MVAGLTFYNDDDEDDELETASRLESEIEVLMAVERRRSVVATEPPRPRGRDLEHRGPRGATGNHCSDVVIEWVTRAPSRKAPEKLLPLTYNGV